MVYLQYIGTFSDRLLRNMYDIFLNIEWRVRSSNFLNLESQIKTPLKNTVTAGERSSDFSSTLILAHFKPSHCSSHCAVWPRKYRSTSQRAFWICFSRLSAKPEAGHDNDIIESWLRSPFVQAILETAILQNHDTKRIFSSISCLCFWTRLFLWPTKNRLNATVF